MFGRPIGRLLDSRTEEVRDGLLRSLRGDTYSIAEYAFDCQRTLLHICYDHEAGLVVEAIVRIGHLPQAGFGLRSWPSTLWSYGDNFSVS